jgi:hypothetical protein
MPVEPDAEASEANEALKRQVGDCLLRAERELREAQRLVHANRDSEAARARLAGARRAMALAQRCATYLTLGLPNLA